MKLIEWPYYQEGFLKSQGFSKDFLDRFWSKIVITRDCWIWNAKSRVSGYGMIRLSGSRKCNLAHRISWILNRGPIPEGMEVLHNCPAQDNKLCVRPSHLYLGTQLDNMRDASRKDQIPKGEFCGFSKLKELEVFEIRRLWHQGVSQPEIASVFGISRPNVSMIVNRKTWNHI